MREDMRALFAKYLPLLEAFVTEEALRFFVPATPMSCCASMLRIIDGMIDAEGLQASPGARFGISTCAMVWAFAAVWGYGGALAVDRVIDGRKVRINLSRHAASVSCKVVCLYLCLCVSLAVFI
jgi:hypothetical protein